MLAGGALYLFGTFGVTMLFNVPLNNALAALSPEAPDTAARWADYVTRWSIWNHVRGVAALLALVVFILDLHR